MADSVVPKVALATLAEQHLRALCDTVQYILSTQRAEYVLAQVAEGIQTKETARYKLHGLDPQIKNRIEPGLAALNLVRSWMSEFRLETLEIDANILQAYRNSSPGTKAFKLRLIETTAVVVHSLAALLFEHTNDPPYKYPSPTRKVVIVDGLAEVSDELIPTPFPTFLYHRDYFDHDLYPMGVVDVVAYWTETQLFGGVVVFDHGKSDAEFLDVSLHPDCSFKVFKLSDAQIDQFIGLSMHGSLQSHPRFQLSQSAMLSGSYQSSPCNRTYTALGEIGEPANYPLAGIQWGD
ncbi:hypothetical protein PHISCL_05670 [Aspergillus sclerotialis]|uniref:Uncharacterized protein n=1 Tax=Aspergillus sclerotialis TaxID=2070753 RepID=A0A3A2ZVI1_9EURO|nr:hypothetical protein PHISCL_05670 [Aspergillus sclerotialis]